MSPRRKAFTTLAATVLVSFFLAWLVTPWADIAAVAIVIGIAPAATLFAVIYMFTRPWWTTIIGRAMLISSSGLALLVDIALLYKFFGDNYALRDAVRLTVYWMIFLGAWYKLAALVLERPAPRRGDRVDGPHS